MAMEERIRELCGKAIAVVDDPEELESVLAELKLALHEHTERLRAMRLSIQFCAPIL